MAKELECSVDYLINDAMKQYARQRGYGTATTMGTTTGSVAVAPPIGSMPLAPPPPPVHAAPPPVPSHHVPPPPPPPAGGLPPPLGGMSRPTPPPKRQSVAAPPPPPPPGASVARRPPGAPPPLAPPRSLPPLPGGSMRPHPSTGALSIHYQGEVFPVTKDRFVIGRGKQSSDLTIKDPNVSRQHAVIEFSNGQYYIVDMGSTNGVEYNGQRVQRRVIGEGDVFRVCDHELRFSFQ